MKISRRKFLQVTGLAAGASMLPLPVKFLGAGKAEAFYQTVGVPLYANTLRLTEIPVAIPIPQVAADILGNPALAEGAQNDVAPTFPVGFPKYFPPSRAPYGAPLTGVRHYTFSLNQYQDPGVVPSLGPTTLWGYKPALTLLEGLTFLGLIPNQSGAPLAGVNVPPFTQQQLHLGGIMLVESYQPVQITMVNNLELNHIIPNDLTIPGADLGPDRTAVHFHGGLVPWISDGGPFDWFCSTKRSPLDPNPIRQPACGSSFINNVVLNPAAAASKTQGEYYWPNQQSARFGWFHDHAFGITRLNAYAGVATGQVFRDDFERNLVTLGLPPLLENSILTRMGLYPNSGLVKPNPLTAADYQPIREYPIVVQDKIFINNCNGGITKFDPTWPATCPQTSGSLWYPHTYERARWRRNYSAQALRDPSVIPEMFGDTILCNGTAYPILGVNPRRYRFRMLNAQNARFLNMQLYYAWELAVDGAIPAYAKESGGIVLVSVSPAPTGFVTGQVLNRPFVDGTVSTMTVPTPSPDPRLVAGSTYGPGWITQIGVETGFIPKVIAANVSTQTVLTAGANPNLNRQQDFALLLGPAERPDIIVDFSLSAGKSVILYGDAPGPFPGGDVRNDYFPGLVNGNTVNLKTSAKVGPNSRVHMKFVVGKQVTGPPDGATTVVPGLNLSAMPAVNNCAWNSEGLLTTVDANGFPQPSVPVTRTIQVGLYEDFDAFGRLQQDVGSITSGPVPYAITTLLPEEIHYQGDVEIWEVYNTTADTHPMHWHLYNVQILNRQAFSALGVPTGPLRPPLADEYGFKETIKCWPGEIVRFIVKVGVPAIKKFDGTIVPCPTSPRGTAAATPGTDVYDTNEYVWHCHILEHEEHDMMRPLCVAPIPVINAPPVQPPQ